MNRRSLLVGAGCALAGSFAGCLSRLDGHENGQGTQTLQVRLWLTDASLSASERGSVNPIVVEKLSTEEQEIVQTALDEGEYTVDQESASPALERLRDRIEQRTGNGETLEAYLRRTETYYRIGFADGDHVIAHPDCCRSGPTADQTTPPDRPWPPSEPIEKSDGTHHLFVENYTDTTEAAWLRVVREDGATLVDGRYELPDGRGIKFEDIAAWETTYTVELAIDGEDIAALEWYTEECSPDSEASDGSRNGAVRVTDVSNGDEHQVSFVRDQCDAIYAPGVPTGAAETFRLDQ